MNFLVLNWRDVLSPQAGGSEFQLQEILQRAVAAGHQVTMVASHFAGCHSEDRAEADGVSIVRSGNWRVANYTIPRAARKLAEQQHFDLVVDALTKLPFFAPLWFRETPILGIAYHLFGATLFKETDPLQALYCLGFEALIPRVYRRTPLIAISESTRSVLIGRGIPAEQIQVVHCGHDAERYRPLPGVRREDPPLLIVVSRLKRYKCVDHPIRALPAIRARVPGTRLVIAGSGDDRPRLEALTKNLGLEEAVQFLGHVSEPEKVELYCRARLFINTSHKEGWGLTSIEANACGTPVVAADRPGLRDSVRKETGALVPWGDINELAGAVIRLLEDKAQWRRLSRNAIQWAARFSWDLCAAQMLDYMEQAAAGARVLEPAALQQDEPDFESSAPKPAVQP
ncbi:MAG: glycosyltransferase family 4 protein [Planctomycetota bacterium]